MIEKPADLLNVAPREGEEPSILRLAHRAITVLCPNGLIYHERESLACDRCREAHAAIDRAVEAAKAPGARTGRTYERPAFHVEPDPDEEAAFKEALSKRDAEWREALAALHSCRDGTPACGVCRTVARMTT